MTEHLTIDPTVAAGICGMCRRQIGEHETRLNLGLRLGDVVLEVALCRPCISEHAPELLEVIEDDGPLHTSLG